MDNPVVPKIYEAKVVFNIFTIFLGIIQLLCCKQLLVSAGRIL